MQDLYTSYGCGSKFCRGSPPNPLLHTPLSRPVVTYLYRKCLAQVRPDTTLSQRYLSLARRFCYKPMPRNGRQSLLRTQVLCYDSLPHVYLYICIHIYIYIYLSLSLSLSVYLLFGYRISAAFPKKQNVQFDLVG